MGRRGGGVRAAGVRTEERDRASEALVRCATQSRAGAGHACGEGKRMLPSQCGSGDEGARASERCAGRDARLGMATGRVSQKPDYGHIRGTRPNSSTVTFTGEKSHPCPHPSDFGSPTGFFRTF
jgi:hypothetical protein